MLYEPPDLTGAVLNGQYRLRKRIGWGGMGTVYATDSFENGRRLAVKLLNPDERQTEDVVRRFIEEGKLCQRLKHPNIVQVFDVAVAEDGSPYLVMEFLSGVPLAAYTNQGGRVPITQAILILRGLLAGLAHAHAEGVVHRDLKPDNVYLALDSHERYSVKILDFGIAKVMESAGGMGKRTSTGMLLGTPAYMSPEQIRSAKDVDARSDLFSVGVLAYEMLSGRSAFPAPTEYAKLAAVLNTEPMPLADVDPALSSLSDFVHRALRKNPAERYQSAVEMAAALASTLGERLSTGVMPLSRLPEMPAHLGAIAPASLTPDPGVEAVGAATSSGLDSLLGGTPATKRTVELPMASPSPAIAAPFVVSQQMPTDAAFAQRPVAIVHKPTGTLPSHGLPMLEPKGPSKASWWWLVVGGLVLLVAGVAIGLLAATLGR